jgi:hypothetical protein
MIRKKADLNTEFVYNFIEEDKGSFLYLRTQWNGEVNIHEFARIEEPKIVCLRLLTSHLKEMEISE